MSILEEKLEPLVNNVISSLENKDYYSALFLSLSLPDICSSIASDNSTNGKKYANFIEKYFVPLHDYDKEYMNGYDIYALRCSILHNGSNDISEQYARKILSKYTMTVSDYGSLVHNNLKISKDTTVLIIDVKEFCLELIDAVKAFIAINNKNDVCNNNAKRIFTFANIDREFEL